MDLVIEGGGLVRIVVENKVFSLPSLTQLDRYARVAAKLPGPTVLVLSLVDPCWSAARYVTPSGQIWQFRSYADLESRLHDLVPLVRERDAFAGDLLEHYCSFVLDLQELANHFENPEGDIPWRLSGDVAAALDGGDLVQVAERFHVRGVRHRIEGLLSDSPASEVSITDGFAHGQPLVEGFFALDDQDDVGLQLQGDQLLLAMRIRSLSGRSPSMRDQREQHARQHSAWFDFSDVRQLLGDSRVGPDRPPAVDRFNRFDPDFVYRSVTVTGVAVQDVVDLGGASQRKSEQLADAAGRGAVVEHRGRVRRTPSTAGEVSHRL